MDYFSGSYEVIDDNTCEHSGTFEVDADGVTEEYVLTGLRPGLTYQVGVGAVVEAVGDIEESSSEEASDTFTTGTTMCKYMYHCSKNENKEGDIYDKYPKSQKTLISHCVIKASLIPKWMSCRVS